MKLPSTNRIEAFSDGVIAIIVTLLVLEIKIPELEEHTLAGFFAVMRPIFPKLIGFAFSFFTVAIFGSIIMVFFTALNKRRGACFGTITFCSFS